MQAVAGRMGRVAGRIGAMPRSPTAWFTVSLVVAIMLVMIAEIAVSDHGLRWIVDTFGLHSNEADWTEPRFLLTLVTNQFLHGGSSHFFFNTIILLLAGSTLEQRVGPRGTLGIWLFGGVFSNFAHIALLPNVDSALIGASGGIAAVLGAVFVVGGGVGIPVRLRRGGGTLFSVTLPLVIGAWLTLQVVSFVQFLIVSPVPGTAYWAHLAGFAFGAFVAATFYPTSAWRLSDRSLMTTETASAGD